MQHRIVRAVSLGDRLVDELDQTGERDLSQLARLYEVGAQGDSRLLEARAHQLPVGVADNMPPQHPVGVDGHARRGAGADGAVAVILRVHSRLTEGTANEN